jgi:hypothetical protein
VEKYKMFLLCDFCGYYKMRMRKRENERRCWCQILLGFLCFIAFLMAALAAHLYLEESPTHVFLHLVVGVLLLLEYVIPRTLQ